MALIVLALANPSLTREHRDPLSSIAVVVVDKSPSQDFGDRTSQTEAARTAVVEQLHRIPGLETRVIEAGQADGETDGTRLFTALGSALADVPADRMAGVIMITDGRVHDVPSDAGSLGFAAPVHALITGHKSERDRRVALIAAPRFGIVGQPQTITYRVEDQGANPGTAQVTVRRDGDIIDQRTVPVGVPQDEEIPIPHGGQNIVEIEASPLPGGELTQVNNRAVVSIDGVRDKLRVLLVSGEPNAGERTWRNLLKSDPSVDLVHFTILRPPEKQDGTPINELSLIAFPTRELFQQKIDQFQLIIFDRYARQGVLPMIYFDNIARYVRDGGAVLVAAGPDYASPTSVWHTPLDAILPAEPTGEVTDQAFHPRLTELGERHPVTRGLEGSDSNPPHWSQWFRIVDTQNTTGTAVMQGPDQKPLLVLAHQGEGRVALLLSDQLWLWARGFQGGGPHLDLLRRLSHWLMKEPDLEEESLRLTVSGHNLVVRRQTMADTAADVTLTAPSGAKAHAEAQSDRARRVGIERQRQRAWPVARDRRQAQCIGQYRPGQSARICGSNVDDLGHVAAHGRDRRRFAAPRRRRRSSCSAHRRGPLGRHLQRRRLDRPEDARGQRGARHRRAAGFQRHDRAVASARQPLGRLGTRRALNSFRPAA